MYESGLAFPGLGLVFLSVSAGGGPAAAVCGDSIKALIFGPGDVMFY